MLCRTAALIVPCTIPFQHLYHTEAQLNFQEHYRQSRVVLIKCHLCLENLCRHNLHVQSTSIQKRWQWRRTKNPYSIYIYACITACLHHRQWKENYVFFYVCVSKQFSFGNNGHVFMHFWSTKWWQQNFTLNSFGISDDRVYYLRPPLPHAVDLTHWVYFILVPTFSDHWEWMRDCSRLYSL